MSTRQTLSRRRFLARSAAIAAPCIIPSSALGLAGTVAPSNRIVYGLVGCGGHGTGWNLDQIFRMDDAQVIAVCDVDPQRLGKARDKVRNHYGGKRDREYKGCDGHGDFRELINRKDIDVVANCTPDHWHVMPAMMAAAPEYPTPTVARAPGSWIVG